MKTHIMLSILLLLLATPLWAETPPPLPPDGDGDGVADSADLCPAEDSSYFDANGDGCLDDVLSARHTEFWDPADLPLVYLINDQGAPGITNGSDTAAIDNAFSAWTSVNGVALSASNGGTTTQMITNALDGVNLVTFADDEYDFGSAVLAVGLTTSFTETTWFQGRWVRPGQTVDADMLFNPAQEFRTPTSGGFGSDIQSVATHEAGHLFGLAHSAVETSTMFFVLPPGLDAVTLETEDEEAIFKAYPETTALAAGARLSGKIFDDSGSVPIAGGAVFLMDTASDDTVGCDYSLPDGSFEFAGLPAGTYHLSIHPLDGSASIGHLIPGYVNELVDSTAVALFVPEFWDTSESNSDDPTVASGITLTAGEVRTDVDLIANVDNTPPTVTEVLPDGSSLVRTDAALLISFDEAIDDATVASNFKLENITTGSLLSGSIAIFEDDQVMAFTPNGGLGFDTNYRLTLDTGLSDLFGNGLATQKIVDFSTETRPPVSLTSILPTKGVSGTVIVINGEGFDPNPSNNSVYFDIVAATVQQASPTRLLVEVPADAATGEITVVTSGNTSNGIVFSVVSATDAARGTQLGGVELGSAPHEITILPEGDYAYVATDSGVSSVVINAGLAGYLLPTAISLDGSSAIAVSASPDGKRVYAVSESPSRLYEIDSDPIDGTLFNTVLDQISLNASPLGITVGPGGRFAYIPTSTGTIQVFDVGRESATYRRQVNEIVAPSPSLRGAIAVDPTHDRVLALSGSGNLWVFDSIDGSLVSEIGVGLDPRDVTVEPAGILAYVSDGNGGVDIIDLSTLSSTLTIAATGSQRGLSITPDGLFLYAANRGQNQVDVIDLNPSNATFLTVASSIEAGAHPTDVKVSPDGLYLYTLVEDTQRLEVTGIGFGPVIKSIVPKAAPVGAKVVIAGEDLPFGVTALDFNGILVFPDRGTGTALEVTVPLEFTSGPVTALRDVGASPDNPNGIQESNSVYLELLGPTPGTNDGLRAAGSTPTIPTAQLTNEIAISPSGDILAVASNDGEVELIDINPKSSSFNQQLGFVGLASESITDLVFTPDGKRLYAATKRGGEVYVLNTDRLSVGFAQEWTFVSMTRADPSFTPEKLAMSPDGEFLIISDSANNLIAVADIIPGSIDENTIIDWTLPFGLGYATEITFHPGGAYAYVTVKGYQIHVIDVDPTSASYLTQVAALDVPLTPNVGTQQFASSLSFTPDGSRCFVLTVEDSSSSQSHFIVTLDTSDPVNPSLTGQQPLGTSARSGVEVDSINISPKGDRLVLNEIDRGLRYFDISSTPYVELQGFYDANAGAPMGQAWSIDGRRLYMVGTISDNVLYFDFSGASVAQVISGNHQTGVAGRELPAPVRVRVLDYVGLPTEGATVTFFGTDSAGVGPDDLPSQVVLTDNTGIAETSWRLRATAGEDTLGVFIQGVEFDFVITATAVEDPETLPLQVAQVLPLDHAADVSATTAVQTTFSRAVDAATVVPLAYFVQGDGATVPIPALVGFADSGRKISLTPSTPLSYETSYHVEVTTSLRDLGAGPLLSPSSTIFTTAAAPPLALLAVSPPSGPVDAELVLSGQGFDADPSTMKIYFNDLVVSPTSGGIDFLRVRVPPEAITGDLRIENGTSDSSASLPFKVLIPTDSPVDEVLAVVSAGVATRSVAVTPDGTRAYTVSTETNTVIPIDLVSFVSSPSITVGAQPVAIAMTWDGTRAYVANFASNSLSVIDTDTLSTDYNTVIATIPVGLGPIDVAVSPSGDRVYVAHSGEPGFDVIDGNPGSATYHQVLLSVTGGSKTKSVAVSPDGTLLYFGTDDGYVVVGTGDYNSVLATVGGRSSTKTVAVSPDGTLLFVLTTEGTVDIFDVNPGSSTENQVLLSVTGGSKTKSVAVSPDGTLLYLVQEGSDEILVVSLDIVGSVSALDPSSILPPPRLSYSFVDTISVGGNPAVVAFDPSGSGLTVVATNSDQNLTILNTSSVLFGELVAVVDVTPNTLNLSSRGRWVTGRIELPRGFFVQEIDLSTVLLNETVPAELDPVSIEDADQNGLDELVVKFDREAFQNILEVGEYVEAKISGMATDRSFAGRDTIRTIRPQLIHPVGGEFFSVGPTIPVAWELPKGWTADFAVVEWSGNEGMSWNLIDGAAPAEGSIDWTVPYEAVGENRILVTLYEDSEEIGKSLSRTFTVDLAVPVVQVQAHAAVDGRDVVLDWTSTTFTGLEGFRVLRAEGSEGVFQPVGERDFQTGDSGASIELQYRDEGIRANVDYLYKLQEIWNGDAGASHGPISVRRTVINSLGQNYPNSFNPRTTIAFSTATDGKVKLTVYDLRGRKVTTLINEFRRADEYKAVWNGTDDNGAQVASGTYFYRLAVSGFAASRKMVLIR